MAEGASIKLTGVICAAADHPDCGVDEWDVADASRSLRVNFNWHRDPVGSATLRVEPNGDLWCDAELHVGWEVDPVYELNHLGLTSAWAIRYSKRGEHRVTGTMITSSLIDLPAYRVGDEVAVQKSARYHLEARVPRVLMREVKAELFTPFDAPVFELFELGLSVHGDLVPLDERVTAVPDEVAISLVRERRQRMMRRSLG